MDFAIGVVNVMPLLQLLGHTQHTTLDGINKSHLHAQCVWTASWRERLRERRARAETAGDKEEEEQHDSNKGERNSASIHSICASLSDGAFRKPVDHKVGLRPFKAEAQQIVRSPFGHSKL